MSEPILVTGAAGFLGSHVVEALLWRGRRVVGVDNFDPFYPRETKERNVRACRDAAGSGGAFEFVEADITNADAMRSVFSRSRPEGVIHLAAKAGVRPSIADPVGYTRTNVLGTGVLLEATRAAGCRRVVVASSSSIYGNNPVAPFSEDDDAGAPISPYAATKRACELVCHAHWAVTRMPTACLRFFTIFGPRQRPDLAIAAFLARAARGEPIEVFGDGSTSRDYTYVGDAAAGVLAAYERIHALGYRIWNVGSDRPVRLDEVVRTIARVTGFEPSVRRLPRQAGDVEHTWADLNRARAELDYRPSTPFEEGVRRQWQWSAPR